MRILRLVAAAILLAYASAHLAAAAVVAAARAGVFAPPADAPSALLELIAGVSAGHLALWIAAIALYLAAAVQLIRRVKSFSLWALAFLADAASWLWFRDEGSLALLVPDLMPVTYAVLAANLVIGGTVMLLGRTHLD